MKKKPIFEVNYFCNTCAHLVPNNSNLDYKNQPFMGNCKYSEFAFLINHNYCKNYKAKFG